MTIKPFGRRPKKVCRWRTGEAIDECGKTHGHVDPHTRKAAVGLPDGLTREEQERMQRGVSRS